MLRCSINLLALVIAGEVVQGVRIQSILGGAIAAAVLAIVNAVLRPVVIFLTLPINLLTLGLFTFIINAGMLKLVSELVPGLVVESFRAAFFGALLISIISWSVNLIIGENGHFLFIRRSGRGGR